MHFFCLIHFTLALHFVHFVLLLQTQQEQFDQPEQVDEVNIILAMILHPGDLNIKNSASACYC